ncbi:MAG: hypothetical protein J6C44_02905 [Muribaculaceae bacterium]|nr:hypothetical protein [Muribaculaceae bacterium]
MMITLKKAIKFMPVAVLSLCLAACGSDEPNNPEQPETHKTVKSVKVMYIYDVSEDMLRVADIEAKWTNPDGTKDSAKITKTKSQLVSTYATFPAKASISMKMTPKTPAPADNEEFKLAAGCSWYAYEVTYSDGTKYTETSSTPSTSGLPTLGKDVTKYIERLNTRLSDISYSISISDTDSGISITQINN